MGNPREKNKVYRPIPLDICRLGYLMNFNVQHFKDGFTRMVY